MNFRIFLLFLVIFVWSRNVFAADAKLVSQLRTYVTKNRPVLEKSGKLAFSVFSLDNNELIVSENEDEQLIPASLIKLFTTAAALRLLGGQYRFPTEVFLDHLPSRVDPEGKERVDFQEPIISVGNLYIRGYGDPSFDTLRLNDLALAVRQYGISKVTGVIVDDSLFAEPLMRSGQMASEAGTSALSINRNCYAVYVAPGRAATPAFVSLTPGLPFRLVNQVLSIRGREQSVAIDLRGEKLLEPTVTVRGTFGTNAEAMVLWQALPNIPEAFRLLLREAMLQAGVEMGGEVRKGEVPKTAQLLESFESRSLAEILRDMNQQSSNMIAHQLQYALGQDSDGYFRRDLGLKRIQDQSEEVLEAERGSISFADASGFSRRNMITIKQIRQLLQNVAKDFSIFPEFISSLGRYGMGTLRSRELLDESFLQQLRGEEARTMKNRLRSIWVKTGTLEGVSGLAGYAVSRVGERVVFVLLMNGVKEKLEAVAFEDGFMRTLIGADSGASDVDVPLPR